MNVGNNYTQENPESNTSGPFWS